jgi:hypothetical protein
MFETVFRIIAQVESNEQGQRVFQVSEHGAPANDTDFLSFLATVYQEEVYSTLRAGDTLTITAHLDVPPREVERTVRFREDRQFEGAGLQQPIADLLPFVRALYENFVQQMVPGDVFTITYRVAHL